MTTLSSHLGLVVPSQGDNFSTVDLSNNYGVIDSSPGALICTSTTRPSTWTGAQTGMAIYETDTGLTWRWSGSAWVRSVAKGYLGGAPRTSDIATTSTSPVEVVSCTIAVPAGNRVMAITASWCDIGNTAGSAGLFMLRDTTLLKGPWLVQGKSVSPANATELDQGGSMTIFDRPAPGTYVYKLSMSATLFYGGTTTCHATSTTPTNINVVEI